MICDREDKLPRGGRRRQSSSKPTIASLYSGCGGFDVGFEAAGFEPIAAFDIDPQAVAVFNANIRSVAQVWDLSESSPDVGQPDVLLAGSPCQGFSTSGKRLIGDPRNHLLFRAGEIAAALKPKVFVLENVPAALSGCHSEHWCRVEDLMRLQGYNVRRFLAKGTESGVAQLRNRMFMIAWRGSDCIQVEPSPRNRLNLKSSLAGLDAGSSDDAELLPAKTAKGKIARRIGPGQKLSNVRGGTSSVHTWQIPEVYGVVSVRETELLNTLLVLRRRDRRREFGDADPVRPSTLKDALGWNVEETLKKLIAKGYIRQVGRYVDLVHTYNGKFRRLQWDAPSPTVDTHFGDPSLFLHPKFHRGFSSREAARIQGFRDDFEFPEGRTAAFRMIGNAVPPPMSERIAEFVRDCLI